MKKKRDRPSPTSLIALDSTSIIAEQCRIALTNIQFTSIDKPIKTIAVTSSKKGEGKSTIAANLAIVASENKKVLLVDCDLRRPSVGLTFILSNSMGLSNFLTESDTELEEFIQKSHINNLKVMTSGSKPPNPSLVLSSKRMEAFIDSVYNLFDFVIFDCPPVLGMTDTQIIAPKVDGILLVVRENYTDKMSLIKAKESLGITGSNLLGVAYNGITKKDAGYYYY